MNGDARIGSIVRSNIAQDELSSTVDAIIDIYREKHSDNEPFASFIERIGTEEMSKLIVQMLDTPDAIEARSRAAEEIKATAEDTINIEHSVKFKTNGKSTTVKIGANEKILQKGLDEGLSLPYSCQQGSCGTCKLRVKGKFHQGNVEAITPEEIASGYALICMAEPRGDMEVEV